MTPSQINCSACGTRQDQHDHKHTNCPRFVRPSAAQLQAQAEAEKARQAKPAKLPTFDEIAARCITPKFFDI
jgi:hypothetical protein